VVRLWGRENADAPEGFDHFVGPIGAEVLISREILIAEPIQIGDRIDLGALRQL